MKRIAWSLLVASLTACRVATGVTGRSAPTLLVTNQARDSAVVTFTWSNGRTQAATIQAGGFGCLAYTVVADSGTLSITFPTPSGVNAGRPPIMIGPSAWVKVDSTATAYSFHTAALTGPDLAMLITESASGSYAYAMGSAQSCTS